VPRQDEPIDHQISNPYSEFARLSPDAIIIWKLDGTIIEWNPSARRMFGYSDEQVIHQHLSAIMPDETYRLSMIAERVRQGETIGNIEMRLCPKDRQTIHVSFTFSPLRDELNSVAAVFSLGSDVSERDRLKRAERDQAILMSIVSSAEDAIVTKDLYGIVTSWNPGAERLFGYTPEEIIGHPVAKIIPPDRPDEEPQILERIWRGERIMHYETKRMRKDGSLLDVSITVSPIKDSLGQIIGTSKITRDITEIKRSKAREHEMFKRSEEAKRQADQARTQAEKANATKDEFLAAISHELRTPITAILGWTRILASGQLKPEAVQKALETIDRNARAQAQLIEDLLDISRIISGKLRVDFKTVDLTAVIAAAVDAIRPAAGAKNVRVDSVFHPGVGTIVGDPARLQQVAWNLLSNAIKFTPHGGLIQVELQRVDSQVELRIADNGIGISKTFLPDVFERLSQADSSITWPRGIGMGLAIVKSLVELHGGIVSVFSAGEGKGSEFTVQLPVSELRDDSILRPVIEKPTTRVELKRCEELVGLKILIIDDEKDACEILRFVLHECGAVVETAQSVDEGLVLFDSWHPDILVSDIGMPEKDGYDLIHLIRNERRSSVPAVGLTGMVRIEDRMKVLTAGYQMHVAKPFEPGELITIVSSLAGLVCRRAESSSG
jgi:PAS domain S-box-containing protein